MCSECGLDKPLTVHGTCWKCHVGGIQTKGGCKGCRSTQRVIDEHRIDHKVATSSRVIGEA